MAHLLFASAIQQSITCTTCLAMDSLNLSSVTLGLGILVFHPTGVLFAILLIQYGLVIQALRVASSSWEGLP